MLDKLFKATEKNEEKSPVYSCPHCKKKIYVAFEVESKHNFNQNVVTENKIINTKIQKHG